MVGSRGPVLIYMEDTLDEIYRHMRLDSALHSPNFIVLQHAITGFGKIVEGFEIWKHTKTQEIWSFLENLMRVCPFHIKENILKTMLMIKAKEEKSPIGGFKIMLKKAMEKPVFLTGLEGAVQLMTDLVLGNEEMLAIAKACVPLKDALWGMICSPYASLQHYYRYELGSLYRVIYGFDWSEETMDAAWQAQMDQAVPTMTAGEGGFARHHAVAMEEGSIEPVDISAGDWKAWSYTLLDRMINHDFAEPFCEPVDHIKLGLRDYLDIIKHPMDFATIKHKLDSDYYPDFIAFCSDICLVFDNCRLYNMEGSLIYSWAETLDAYFQVLTKPIRDKLGIVKEDITRVKLRLEDAVAG